MKRLHKRLLLAFVTATLFAGVGGAQTTWTGASGNTNWFDAGNWTSGTPDTSVAATIAPAATQPSLSSGPARCASLVVQESAELTLSGGDLDVASGLTLEWSGGTTPTGKVTVTSSASDLEVGGTWSQFDPTAFTPGAGTVDLNAATMAGPAATTFWRLRFLAGSAIVAVPTGVQNQLIADLGATTTGAGWIRLNAPVSGTLVGLGSVHDVRNVGGTWRASFGSTISMGTMRIEGGRFDLTESSNVNISGDLYLVGGEFETSFAGGASPALMDVQGDVYSQGTVSAGVTSPAASVRFHGTWFGDAPFDLFNSFVEAPDMSRIAGTAPSFGRLKFLAGQADITVAAEVTRQLSADSGAMTTGTGWIELNAPTPTSGTVAGPGMVHEVRSVGGTWTVAGSASVGTLRVQGGRLVPGFGVTFSVVDLRLEGGRFDLTESSNVNLSGDLYLVGGEFETSFAGGASPALMDVQGDVYSQGTVSAGVTSPAASVRFHGTWFGDAPFDLVNSFVEAADMSRIAGTAPSFGRLKFLAGQADITVAAEVTTLLSTDSGATTTGAGWIRLNAPVSGTLVGLGSVHDVRNVGGTWRASFGSTISMGTMRIEGGRFDLTESSNVNISGDLYLVGGEFETSFAGGASPALMDVQGDVYSQGTVSAGVTSPAASVRFHGTWFGDAPFDLVNSFVEAADMSRIAGTAPSFGRLKFLAGQADITVAAEVTTLLSTDSGATTTGAGWIRLNAPVSGTLVGLGSVHDVRNVGGTWRASFGSTISMGTMRIEGGRFDLTESSNVNISGDLYLVGGEFETSFAGGASPALMDVQGDVYSQGTVSAGVTSPAASVRFHGTWFGDAPFDLFNSFVEAPDMSRIAGTAPSFGRLKFLAGQADITVAAEVTRQLSADSGAMTTGTGWIELNAPTPTSGTVAGPGMVHEVRSVGGTWTVAGSASVGTLRVQGGRLVPGFGVTFSVVDLRLEGGRFDLTESSNVNLSGDLYLVGGEFETSFAGGASPALMDVQGDVYSQGTVSAGVTSPAASVRFHGTWFMEMPRSISSTRSWRRRTCRVSPGPLRHSDG